MIDIVFNFKRTFYSYKLNTFKDNSTLLNVNIFALSIKSISSDNYITTTDDIVIPTSNVYYTIQDAATAVEEHYKQLDFSKRT